MRGRLALVTGLAGALALAGGAQAQTRFEQVDDCKIKVVVPIEFFTTRASDIRPPDEGDPPHDFADDSERATSDYARELEARAERIWNGVNASEAEILATTAGVRSRPGNTGDEDIEESSDDIRSHWARYANEFGVDQNCAYFPCCSIQIDVDVRVRGADDARTPGYHQIGIMGPRFRSYVIETRNPDIPRDVPTDWDNPEHVIDGTEAPRRGFWANRGDTSRAPAAHEIGHLMGIDDAYEDVAAPTAENPNRTVSVTAHGHNHDLMSDNNGFPFTNVLEQLRTRSGFDCDCCPDRDELTPLMQDYALIIGDTGDMIATCDQEGILRQLNRLREQRRLIGLSNAQPREKALAAAQIDYDIRRLERALIDCPRDRVVTGTGGDPVDEALISVGVTTDSQTFCEYDTTGGEDLPLTSTPGGGDDGDDPRDTPVPPGGDDDDDGDDPRDAPGGGQTPGDDGDDPRDAPGDDDPLNPGWIPGLDDDPTWLPGLPESGGDDDDPRDTPTDGDDGDDPGDAPPEEDDGDDPRDITVPVFVKARADVLNSTTGAVESQETPGQVIRLNPPETAAPALPGAGVERDDSGYDREPSQCVTDENGDCVIEMPVASLGLGASALDAFYLDVEAVQRESATLITNEPLTDEQQAALSALAVEGDEIDVTGLSLGADLTGYGYRLDWNVKAGYDWDGALTGMAGSLDAYIEDNTCRDKQPGPPLGWLRLPDLPQSGDLPSQTISLSLAAAPAVQPRRGEAQP